MSRPRIKRDAIPTSLYLEKDIVIKLDQIRGNLSRSVFLEKVIGYLWSHRHVLEVIMNEKEHGGI